MPPAATATRPRLIVTMGVSGAGKSTVGAALAAALGAPFIDGDDLHPRANVEKMRGGIPLTDMDRWPWLDSVAEAMKRTAEAEGAAVCACSALRRVYRDRLKNAADEPMAFFLLTGSPEIIAVRQANRPGHFMPPGLMKSQFETLEPLEADEAGLMLDVADPVAVIVEKAVAWLGRE